jgi:predicted RNA binding protein YcfA (HicA-like mRNA interferase family)
MPKKVRELKSALAKAGFVLLPKRGKGSHTVWQHPLLPGSITVAGKDGDDANRYQEKDVRNALRSLEDLRKSEEQ